MSWLNDLLTKVFSKVLFPPSPPFKKNKNKRNHRTEQIQMTEAIASVCLILAAVLP